MKNENKIEEFIESLYNNLSEYNEFEKFVLNYILKQTDKEETLLKFLRNLSKVLDSHYSLDYTNYCEYQKQQELFKQFKNNISNIIFDFLEETGGNYQEFLEEKEINSLWELEEIHVGMAWELTINKLANFVGEAIDEIEQEEFDKKILQEELEEENLTSLDLEEQLEILLKKEGN